MAFFKKSTAPEAAAEKRVADAEGKLAELRARLADAERVAAERREHAHRTTIDGADEPALDAADHAAQLAARRAETLRIGVADHEAQLATLRAEHATLIDAQKRRAEADLCEAEARMLDGLVDEIRDVMKRLAAASETAGRHVPFDLQMLNHYAASSMAEIPLALQIGAARVRAKGADLVAGLAPLPPPPRIDEPALAPEPEIARTRVFSLASLQWQEPDGIKTCARHVPVDLPGELAAKAIELRYAVAMSDPRARQLSHGYTAPPGPGPLNANLDDPALLPWSAPLGGVAAANMQVVRGEGVQQ